MQKGAHRLFAPWRQETTRSDSSDRDQLSFAYTVARHRLPMQLLGQCVKMRHANKQYCHWYYKHKTSRPNAIAVAKLVRTNLDTARGAARRSRGAEQANHNPRRGHGLSQERATKKRIAILVAGTAQRYFFNSSVERLMYPSTGLKPCSMHAFF